MKGTLFIAWTFVAFGIAAILGAIIAGALHQLFIAGMSIIGACVHFSENNKGHE